MDHQYENPEELTPEEINQQLRDANSILEVPRRPGVLVVHLFAGTGRVPDANWHNNADTFANTYGPV